MPKKSSMLFLTIVSLFIVLLYLPAFFINPYCDDLLHMAIAKSYGLNPFHKQTISHLFRPVERFINGVNYIVFQDRTYISILSNLLIYLAGVYCVWFIARKFWTKKYMIAYIAVIIYAFHSVNATAVFEIDTISQNLSVLMILVCVIWYVCLEIKNPLLLHGFGTVLLLLTFLSKEIVIGSVFCIPIFSTVNMMNIGKKKITAVKYHLLLTFSSVFLTFVIYLLMRINFSAQILANSGSYTFHYSPLNILKNIATTLFSIGYLGSTLEILIFKNVMRIILSSVLTISGCVIAGSGLYHSLSHGELISRYNSKALVMNISNDYIKLIFAAVLFLAGFFPIALLGHVSEQYSIFYMPFFSLIFAYFANSFTEIRSNKGRNAKVVSNIIAIFLIIYCIWMAFGVREKLNVAAQIGKRTVEYKKQIDEWLIQALQYNNEVRYCFEGDTGIAFPFPSKEYSVFSKRNSELVAEFRYLYNVMPPPWNRAIQSDTTCDFKITIRGENLLFPNVNK